MKTMKASAIVPVVLVIMSAVACSSAPQQSTAPVNVHPVSQATPPPITTTPVPIVHAHAVASAGRPDPFVTLFGPPTGGGNPAPTKVAVSNFPNIPTLPGFENAPGAKDLWSGVKLTGVVDHGGRMASRTSYAQAIASTTNLQFYRLAQTSSRSEQKKKSGTSR